MKPICTLFYIERIFHFYGTSWHYFNFYLANCRERRKLKFSMYIYMTDYHALQIIHLFWIIILFFAIESSSRDTLQLLRTCAIFSMAYLFFLLEIVYIHMLAGYVYADH